MIIKNWSCRLLGNIVWSVIALEMIRNIYFHEIFSLFRILFRAIQRKKLSPRRTCRFSPSRFPTHPTSDSDTGRNQEQPKQWSIYNTDSVRPTGKSITKSWLATTERAQRNSQFADSLAIWAILIAPRTLTSFWRSRRIMVLLEYSKWHWERTTNCIRISIAIKPLCDRREIKTPYSWTEIEL